MTGCARYTVYMSAALSWYNHRAETSTLPCPPLRLECAGRWKMIQCHLEWWKLLCWARGICSGNRRRIGGEGGGVGGGGEGSGYFWLSVSLSKSRQQAKHADGGGGRGRRVLERERREIETLLGWCIVSFTSTQLLLENSAPCPTKPPGMTWITRMAEPSTADTFSFDVGLTGLAHSGKINNEGDTGAQCGNEIPGLEGFVWTSTQLTSTSRALEKAVQWNANWCVLMGLLVHQPITNCSVEETSELSACVIYVKTVAAKRRRTLAGMLRCQHSWV